MNLLKAYINANLQMSKVGKQSETIKSKDLFQKNETKNLNAYEGLANKYDMARPSYPPKMYESIMCYCDFKGIKPIIADIGCGTGISTRAFYNFLHGECYITGVEPGNDMRKVAAEVSHPGINYVEGTAESIPLPNASVDIITVAQAAQWFNRTAFYPEAQRILKPTGVIAIYENNRDWQHSEFLAKHEEFLEQYSVDLKTQKHYSRDYRDFPYELELASNFKDPKSIEFSWTRKMSPENFLAMAKTSTQVKRAIESIGENKVNEIIIQNIKNFITVDEAQIMIPYNTKLYIARR